MKNGKRNTQTIAGAVPRSLGLVAAALLLMGLSVDARAEVLFSASATATDLLADPSVQFPDDTPALDGEWLDFNNPSANRIQMNWPLLPAEPRGTLYFTVAVDYIALTGDNDIKFSIGDGSHAQGMLRADNSGGSHWWVDATHTSTTVSHTIAQFGSYNQGPVEPFGFVVTADPGSASQLSDVCEGEYYYAGPISLPQNPIDTSGPLSMIVSADSNHFSPFKIRALHVTIEDTPPSFVDYDGDGVADYCDFEAEQVDPYEPGDGIPDDGDPDSSLDMSFGLPDTNVGSGVGETAIWEHVASQDGIDLDLHAEVIAADFDPTFSLRLDLGVDDDFYVGGPLGASGSVTVRYTLVEHGTDTPVAANVAWTLYDIDSSYRRVEGFATSDASSYLLDAATEIDDDDTLAPLVVFEQTSSASDDPFDRPEASVGLTFDDASTWDITYSISGDYSAVFHNGNGSTVDTSGFAETVLSVVALDTDGDGVPDDEDVCPGGDDTVDTDGDGTADFCDACPVDPFNDSDGDGLCDSEDPCELDADNDIDGDGLCADVDFCPNDPDNDFDYDGICADEDICPFDEFNDADGDGVCGNDDVCPGGDDNADADGDGTADFCDVCPLDAANDADGDGICGDVDVCPLDFDNDWDGDGVCGDVDACPYDALDDEDADGMCGDVDPCPVDWENDADGDGICESDDNCPTVANTNQSNVDGDEFGDACEPDNDNDGVIDDDDNCPLDVNADQADFDGDGIGDVCDLDTDGDGIIDVDDVCLGTAVGEPVLDNGCSVDQECVCEAAWKNHGAYTSCVAHASEDLLDAGLITQDEKDLMCSEAGQSDCGHKPNNGRNK